ncbi:MAG: redoxin domain-containing protein [Planctomycetota bacterium]|jgi:peroxiredoxin/tetratricopeptide (TPR) repeat protein
MAARPIVSPLLTAAILTAAFAASPLAAQDRNAGQFGHSRHGSTFDEGPRQRPRVMPGLSAEVHLPVQGLDDETQRLFDQGLCQQHGFWYFEAERSFREVASRVPTCALAYWGMAMANVDNRERAAGFAARAVQHAAALPERERLYVDAIAVLYQIDDALRGELQSGDAARVQKAIDDTIGKAKGGRDEKELQRAFLKGLEAIVAACPDDVEAKALLAIQCWRNRDFGLEITSHAAVDALLDAVFAKAPHHPAHHYRVHLWDAEKAERALRAAAAIGASAPGIAHQWHMAGHVYAKLDRHAEAAWQQEASSRTDHAAMMHDRVMPFLIHNYGHNQEWLARSLSWIGEANAALGVAKDLAALPRHPSFNQLDDDDSIAGYARARLVSVCEDHEMWQEAIALGEEGFLDRTDSVKREVQRLSLLGRAFYRLGRKDDGERIVAEAEALLQAARQRRAEALDRAEADVHQKREPATKAIEAMAEAGRAPTESVRSVLDLLRELRGEQKLAAGDAAAAVVEFEAVPDFPKALLADAHVTAGQAKKAIELLEQEVKERPRRVPTLVRLLEALGASDLQEHKERARELMTARDLEVLLSNPRIARAGGASPLLKRGSFVAGSHCEPVAPTVWSDPAGPLFAADFGPRPPLASLGPTSFEPWQHAGLDLSRASGERFVLAAKPSKPTLVVFYLGFGCLQCVEQLHALQKHQKALAAAGLDIVAIGDDPTDKLAAAIAALPADAPLTFPLLADPEHTAFRAWRCYDEFESLALHGTFLVDIDGSVRWQDLGAQPFAQFDWLLREAERLLALPRVAH